MLQPRKHARYGLASSANLFRQLSMARHPAQAHTSARLGFAAIQRKPMQDPREASARDRSRARPAAAAGEKKARPRVVLQTGSLP